MTGVETAWIAYRNAHTGNRRQLRKRDFIAGWNAAESQPTERWWISTDLIGKPGSPTVGHYYSTRNDALTARTLLERYMAPRTFSVYCEAAS